MNWIEREKPLYKARQRLKPDVHERRASRMPNMHPDSEENRSERKLHRNNDRASRSSSETSSQTRPPLLNYLPEWQIKITRPEY